MKLSKKFLEEINGMELSAPLRNSTVLVQTSKWNSQEYLKFYDDKTPFPLIATFNKKEGIIYYVITKIKRLVKEMLEKYWEEGYLGKNLIEREIEKVERLYEELSYDNISKIGTDQALLRAEEIKDAIWNINGLAFFTLYLDKNVCREFIEKKNADVNLEKIWERAITPISDSFERQKEITYLELKERGEENIVEKCQYFNTQYSHIPSLEEIEETLKEFDDSPGRLEKLKQEKQVKVKEHKEWLKTLTKDEQKIVGFLQESIELRDLRKTYFSKGLTIIYRVAQQLFEELSIDKDLILWATFEELKDKNLDEEELKKRLDGFTMLIYYDGSTESEYEFENQILEKSYLEQIEQSDLIKGQTGMKGRVEGVVRIIRNIKEDSHKFREGDVLVTGMTRPEYVPLMKKAKAIITDEGGITCHAAIVSRELGIPCIIGTKNATFRLKDGEEVIVDADKGIVKVKE